MPLAPDALPLPDEPAAAIPALPALLAPPRLLEYPPLPLWLVPFPVLEQANQAGASIVNEHATSQWRFINSGKGQQTSKLVSKPRPSADNFSRPSGACHDLASAKESLTRADSSLRLRFNPA
jgi:hypothetical protein